MKYAILSILQMLFWETKQIKGEQKVYYSLSKYKTMVYFDILTDISEPVTVVQLMDYLGNMNHDISVVGYCIFD